MAGIYCQHHPEHTVFYLVFFYYFEQFLQEHEHRKLLDSLCLSAVRSLVKFLHTATGLELMPGVLAVIQTFGDRINFHPHIHVLITEGGTAPDGAFHHVSRFHDKVIQGIFTHGVKDPH
jgi:hypothetical protein